MKKSLLLVLLALVLTIPAEAQQDPQFSLYMFNRMALNPAYAGARGAPNVTLAGRTQWVGIDGHPNTMTLSGDLPVNVLHGGLGLTLVQDQIGPISSTYLKGNYAYRFDINQADNTYLQIGIAPGFFAKSIDNSRLIPETQNDPVLNNLIQNRVGNNFQFDLAGGAYFSLKDDKFFVGVSANHLTQPKMFNDPNNLLNKSSLPLSFNTMVGCRLFSGTMGRNAPIYLEPSVSVYNAGSQIQLQANANLVIQPIVLGLSYRGLTNVSDLTGIVGFHASPNLFAAYAYDYTVSGLQTSTSGSHELLLSYTFARVLKIIPPDLDTMDSPTPR